MIARDKPLIICDVDEVVLHFVKPFEAYLANKNARLLKSSFKLNGNIIDHSTNEPYSNAESGRLVRDFHRECVDAQPAVEGAVEALHHLRDLFQIVFLSNVEDRLADRRSDHLKSLGLDFPLITNEGSKAETIRIFSDQTDKAVVFIDDLPPHHVSAKEAVPDIVCIHFMADLDFRKLVSLDASIAHQAPDWKEVKRMCLTAL